MTDDFLMKFLMSLIVLVGITIAQQLLDVVFGRRKTPDDPGSLRKSIAGRLCSKPEPQTHAGKVFLAIEAHRRMCEELSPKNGFGVFQTGRLPHRVPLPRPRNELHELGTINRLSEAHRRRLEMDENDGTRGVLQLRNRCPARPSQDQDPGSPTRG